MPDSIVDLINIQDDTEDVREEWCLLVEPLSLAIKLPVEKSPNELYIEKTSKIISVDSRFPKNTLQLPSGGWADQYRFMVDDSILPLILIADVGVGKTSWIERFKSHLDELRNVVCYYYNHHIEKGRPDGIHLEDHIRLHCFLYAKLLETIQETCRKHHQNGLKILDYEVNKAANDSTYIDYDMTKALKEACTHLKENCDVKIFFIIDNLDEYSQEIQIAAVNVADYISTWDCIYPIISLRPETYLRTETRLKHPRHIEIKPVSLDDILYNRFQYLWNNGGRASIKNVINIFERNDMSLSVLWSDGIIDEDPNTLKNLHKKIINVLTDNKILEETLQKLHNYNMREILSIVSKLLLSGFFSGEIIKELKNDTNSRKLRSDREAIITTYLRGPFLRYRGTNSNDYPVKMLNIFDIPSIGNDDMLISVRIMQILGKTNSLGFTVKQIINDLTGIGYKEDDINAAIRFLAKFAFIVDIKEQKPWVKTEDIELSNDDLFVLAPAGNYLITKLFDEFAFRYCEAMADVMHRSRIDSTTWSQDRDYASLVENVIGILKFIVSASEHELKRILESEDSIEKKQSKFEQFKRSFLASDVVGNNFLVTMTKECQERSKYFLTFKNYQGQKKLKNLNNQINTLRDKAMSIYIGYPYIKNAAGEG
jgi:hypothetical protein